MDRRILGPSVFPLGFGCVQLTTQPRQSEAVAILERAFSLGITHFDVARAYGFGRAEGILAQFLRGRRDRVTVATKFGFQMPSGLAGDPRLIALAKRLLGPFPALLRRAQRRGSAMVKAGAFSPEAAIQSLETSLRALPERQRQHSLLPLLHKYRRPEKPIRGTMAPTDRFRAAVQDAKIGPDKDIPHITVPIIINYITNLKLLGLL